MKGWIGWLLLVLSLLVALGGYRNQRIDPDIEAWAKAAACDLGEACKVVGERPGKIRTDVLRQRFEWSTSLGAVTVTCRRRFALAGDWECTSVRGELGE